MQTIPLFVKLCNMEHLRTAWEMVKQKKSAGGIDGVSVADFAKNENQELMNLLAELETQQYAPHPYKEVRIPKDDNEFRILGLPTVRDKVVQQAVKLLIEPLFEPHFLDVSYGYRPNKNALRAVQRVKHFILSEKKYWLVNGDIDAFFDNIPHDKLLASLSNSLKEKEMMDLLELWIKMPRLNQAMKWEEGKKGIPQGNILSPLLSNVYLHQLDLCMVLQKYGFVRYADDFVLLCESQAQANEACKRLHEYICDTLGLSLNATPTVQRVENGFPFLGLWFNGSDTTLKEEKKADIIEKIKAVETEKTGHFTADYQSSIEMLQQYYGKLLPTYLCDNFDMIWGIAVVAHYRSALTQDALSRSDLSIDLWKELRFFRTKEEKERKKDFALWLKAIKSRKALPETILTGTKDKEKATAERMAQRRKEYAAKLNQHKEVIITAAGVFLRKSKGMLVVKRDKKTLAEFPFKKIEHITILSSHFSLSSEFLNQCKIEHIAIHYLDFTGKPIMHLLPPNNISFKTLQAQMSAYENGKGKTLVTKWLVSKLKNQMSLIKYFGKYLKKKATDTSRYETRIAACLQELAEVESDTWEIMRGKWFSIEGRAAQAYWDFVKILLADYVAFEGRARKGADDFVNMCLNYGYGILYSRLRILLHKKALQENLSYLHSPHEANAAEPTLSFDIIEMFRVHVIDRTVFAWLRKEKLPSPLPEKLLSEEIRKTLSEKIIERLDTPEKYRSDYLTLADIMETQIVEIKAYLQGEQNGYLPYLAKW